MSQKFTLYPFIHSFSLLCPCARHVPHLGTWYWEGRTQRLRFWLPACQRDHTPSVLWKFFHRSSKSQKQEASIHSSTAAEWQKPSCVGLLSLSELSFTLVSWVVEPKAYNIPSQASVVSLDVAMATEREVFAPPGGLTAHLLKPFCLFVSEQVTTASKYVGIFTCQTQKDPVLFFDLVRRGWESCPFYE